MADDLNYFVCTLGQAADINDRQPHRFASVNALVDKQAEALPKQPAVAFHRPSEANKNGSASSSLDSAETFDVYTFEDLRDSSLSIAEILHSNKSLRTCLQPKRTIALLAQSTPVLLLTWLALMRTGMSVLLVAPQCQPAAITHLCRTCDAEVLLYDPIYAELAQDSSTERRLRCIEIPFDWQFLADRFIVPAKERTSWPEVNELDIAYLHHTSGTSSGLPKPIPQSHRAACGVLPSLTRSSAATFTTTPLYHGGIADCFRSWTSGALIWLFPGSIPITSKNILQSLTLAGTSARDGRLPSVRYFSSVPYVLQMLAADPDGLSNLQSMHIVGVGGAALPEEVGNELVQKGINLISRFGSSECGFLMSSFRNFKSDSAWQYLRPGTGQTRLKFEIQDDGLSELVVAKDWPHLAKRNRDDGSYATADLFAPHASIPNAWKYHSRADSQLTMVTGKKFDPAPMEDAIAVSTLLTDVLIFGNGKQNPGALLWRSQESKDKPASEVVEEIWPTIKKINRDSQIHARITKSMLVILPSNVERPEKSSKGTLLRKLVEQQYRAEIEMAYEKASQVEDLLPANPKAITEDNMADFLQSVMKRVTGRTEDLPESADLFSQGIDSVACMQIRSVLDKTFRRDGQDALPMNIVYDSGTVEKLSKFLISYKYGETVQEEDEQLLMRQLVDKYGSFDDPRETQRQTQNTRASAGNVYLLTGATGALGAHILDKLMRQSSTSEVICLVRGADEHASFERVSKSLQSRKLTSLSDHERRLVCMPARLGEHRLGLSESVYSRISNDVDVIIHAAWAVNFSTRLRSFEQDHIQGIHNLIRLALNFALGKGPPQLIFCSSTASVISSSRKSNIPETISDDPADASPLGYARSKWVAEAICGRAISQTSLRDRISIVRVGQLCGDTKNGTWNMSEAWPLMLNASRCLSAIPDLGPEPLRWLPVDVAAEELLQIAYTNVEESRNLTNPRVYHVLGQGAEDRQDSTWNNVIQWAKSELGPDPLWVVPLATWIEKLEGMEQQHPAKKLLGLWRSRLHANGTGKFDSDSGDVRFDQTKTLRACSALMDDRVIDRELFQKLWEWIQSTDTQ